MPRPSLLQTVSLCDNDLGKTIYHHLLSSLGRDPERADVRDIYRALSYTMRDVLLEKWIETQKKVYSEKKKRVYYLSLEFLVGRSLGNALINLDYYEKGRDVLDRMGFQLGDVREQEEDAALGNGGLGRLAACYMDSMATLGIPGFGYGIRYEYGLFYQKLIDGFQMEYPDNWLRTGTPWEFERQQVLFPVRFNGNVVHYTDQQGRFHTRWQDTDEVMAMPCDLMVPGYRNGHVINMRLWTAKASRELDFDFFNRGDYISAVKNKVESETISKVLYPSDDIREGQELRLRQQYFFVAATFQDILRRHRKGNQNFDDFSDAVAVQLNDTHPAIAIPELMRLLMDEEGLSWEKSWDISVKTFGYTNHTLMPEALETWPVELLGRVLPRHLEIIYEINRRFLDQVGIQYPGDVDRLRRMSLIEEGPVKKVRMAHLAIVGSHAVNGVAEIHSTLLRERIFPDFDAFFPGRFVNVTNGITPRRWLLKCNRELAELISSAIGVGWISDLLQLKKLEKYAADPEFQKKWRQIKLGNKRRLAAIVRCQKDVAIAPESLFDVQVKRIHEYKRQLLNILHVITLYHRLLSGQADAAPPRTVIFAGKAAPSYRRAKLIIKLINSVADVVNGDVRTRDRLKVVFLPNYSVSLAEKIMPAADLSEQISTAGTEASGTGNMKMALNGALTIGTMDGANIEIAREVGRENMFIFGITLDDMHNGFDRTAPATIYARNPEVRRTVDAIADGLFSKGDRELFRPIVDSLLDPGDPFLLLQDLEDYLDCQTGAGAAYLDQERWTERSILTVARMGPFSSDRSVRQYCERIWGVDLAGR
ncbi:MAG: glycogen/starch/alpha-glucan phosphorylase [Thermodesulfobacteriota bacterium]